MASGHPYEPVFANSALEFFLTLPKRRQRVLLDRCRELAADPGLVPDFQSKDATGRDISHLLVDGFLFDYWIDDAVKRLVITAIELE